MTLRKWPCLLLYNQVDSIGKELGFSKELSFLKASVTFLTTCLNWLLCLCPCLCLTLPPESQMLLFSQNTLLFQLSLLSPTSWNCFCLWIISISLKTHTSSSFKKTFLVIAPSSVHHPVLLELPMVIISISLGPFLMTLVYSDFLPTIKGKLFCQDRKWSLKNSSQFLVHTVPPPAASDRCIPLSFLKLSHPSFGLWDITL